MSASPTSLPASSLGVEDVPAADPFSLSRGSVLHPRPLEVSDLLRTQCPLCESSLGCPAPVLGPWRQKHPQVTGLARTQGEGREYSTTPRWLWLSHGLHTLRSQGAECSCHQESRWDLRLAQCGRELLVDKGPPGGSKCPLPARTMEPTGRKQIRQGLVSPKVSDLSAQAAITCSRADA